MSHRADIVARLPIVFGLDRLQAAAAVGVSANAFDQMIGKGLMPKPRMINSRKVWDVDELRAAFKCLPKDGEAQEDESWADVG